MSKSKEDIGNWKEKKPEMKQIITCIYVIKELCLQHKHCLVLVPHPTGSQ